VFLLSCGTDHISVAYALEKKFRYSILTPYFEGKIPKENFLAVLKYVSKRHKVYHDFLFGAIDGVLASDLDYHIPLEGHPAYLGLIPNPVNVDILEDVEMHLSEKIVIFHGINRRSYLKKGNDYFEKALEIIQKKCEAAKHLIATKKQRWSNILQNLETPAAEVKSLLLESEQENIRDSDALIDLLLRRDCIISYTDEIYRALSEIFSGQDLKPVREKFKKIHGDILLRNAKFKI